MSNLEICFRSGEKIEDPNIMSSLTYFFNQKVSIHDLLKSIQMLLYTQCNLYSDGLYNKNNKISVRVWPWVINVFKVYKNRNFIIEDLTEIPIEDHTRYLEISFIDKQSNIYDLLTDLKRSIKKEIKSMFLRII